MSQSTQRKRWTSLQIIIAACALIITGCASRPEKVSIDPGVNSGRIIKYVRSIDKDQFGSDNPVMRILVGRDPLVLRNPVAIALRDDTMIIFDRGEIIDYAGTQILDKNTAVASAEIAEHDFNRSLMFKYSLKKGSMDIVSGAGDMLEDEISDIYLAKDKTFYVTDVEGRRALRFSESGNLLKIYQDPPNMFRPIAITVDEEKKEVLIADGTYSKIVSFDQDSGEPKYGLGDRGNGPGKFRFITDMVAIPDGYLVSDRVELRVQILDKQGNYIADFGRDQLMFPTALAMDKFGRVYVSDKADNTINVYKAGKRIEKIGKNGYGPNEFRLISDMKIHKDQLYVVDSLNGRIQVFDIVPEGNGVALVQ